MTIMKKVTDAILNSTSSFVGNAAKPSLIEKSKEFYFATEGLQGMKSIPMNPDPSKVKLPTDVVNPLPETPFKDTIIPFSKQFPIATTSLASHKVDGPFLTKLNNGIKVASMDSKGVLGDVVISFTMNPELYVRKKGLTYTLASFLQVVLNSSSENTSYQFQVVSDKERLTFSTSCFRSEMEGVFSEVLNALKAVDSVTVEQLSELKEMASVHYNDTIIDPLSLTLFHLCQGAWGPDHYFSMKDVYPASEMDAFEPSDLRALAADIQCTRRIGVYASNLDHYELVSSVTRAFSSFPEGRSVLLRAESSEDPSHEIFNTDPRTTPTPPWLGGSSHGKVRFEELDASAQASIFSEAQRNEHVAIAFPFNPLSRKELATALVTETLFGGGQSFSAGGPGKGLLSLFYTHVLCRSFVAAAAAVTMRPGLAVGIQVYTVSAKPGNGPRAVTQLVDTVMDVVGNEGPDEDDLSRAKNASMGVLADFYTKRRYTSQVLLQDVEFEGKTHTLESDLDLIASVTRRDVLAFLNGLFKEKPAVGSINLSGSGEKVSEWITNRFQYAHMTSSHSLDAMEKDEKLQ